MIHIFGYGGLAREVTGTLHRLGYTYANMTFVGEEIGVDTPRGIPVLNEIQVRDVKSAVVAVSNPFIREKIVKKIKDKWPMVSLHMV